MIKYVVGIDEAGRGPLAGPVAIGVVVIPVTQAVESVAEARHFSEKWIGTHLYGVRESKQLSPMARERWSNELDRYGDHGVRTAVALVGPKIIDRHGISSAIAQGINRALARLSLPPDESVILLDGLLRAPRQYRFQETIIHGDAVEPLIALASIPAKVRRDRLMVRLSGRFPQYGFERHKGYGTKAHYEAIALYGICEVHRSSYLKAKSFKNF